MHEGRTVFLHSARGEHRRRLGAPVPCSGSRRGAVASARRRSGGVPAIDHRAAGSGTTATTARHRAVAERFAGLDRDELVVLALLHQARSLNEQEIQRAVQHHRLGWFLIKAHMADLIARLRDAGASPIRLRSTGRHNIYEWAGDGAEAPSHMDQRAARDVIDALRQGVVPERHLDLLIVGRQAARDHLVALVGEISEGRSFFKFLRGPYGAGKTFLCAWLRKRTLPSGFAVSTVRIGPDQPLANLPVFLLWARRSHTVKASPAREGTAPAWESSGGPGVPFETAQEAGRLHHGGDVPRFLDPDAAAALRQLQDVEQSLDLPGLVHLFRDTQGRQ